MLPVMRRRLYYAGAIAFLLPLLYYFDLSKFARLTFNGALLFPVVDMSFVDGEITFCLFCGYLGASCLLGCFEFLYTLWKYPFSLKEETDDQSQRLQDAILERRRCGFQGKLVARIVTRGRNPHLIKATVQAAERAFADTPKDMWAIEVVTDKSNGIIETANVQELVVPEYYQTEHGAKYKARALHYAVQNSPTLSCDWIVHLDEETQFNETTVHYMLEHCNDQDRLVLTEARQEYGNIAQGFILFGTGKVENTMTTLMDSFRVGFDQAIIRWQYEQNDVWLGMHGSFFLVSNAVEQDVGWDNGPLGSIAEDTYFAFSAAGKGVRFSFINGLMFEESPFSVWDFIWQRERWSRGMTLLPFCKELPISKRLFLGCFVLIWLWSGVFTVMSLFVTIEVYGYQQFTTILWTFTTIWPYLIGFALTFRMEDGLGRYCLLAIGQVSIIPLGILLESTAPLVALPTIIKHMMCKGHDEFYVVEKRNAAAATIQVDAGTSTCTEPVHKPIKKTLLRHIQQNLIQFKVSLNNAMLVLLRLGHASVAKATGSLLDEELGMLQVVGKDN